jgi:transposase-like protein
LLSEHRDIAAAKQFFIRAIKQHGIPEKSNVDGYLATHTAISELKAQNILPQNMKVRASKYLNNIIEQDHRRVRQRIYPMLGLKKFANAVVTISGVELAHKIRKGQFNTEQLMKGAKVRVSQLWEAVLAA